MKVERQGVKGTLDIYSISCICYYRPRPSEQELSLIAGSYVSGVLSQSYNVCTESRCSPIARHHWSHGRKSNTCFGQDSLSQLYAVCTGLQPCPLQYIGTSNQSIGQPSCSYKRLTNFRATRWHWEHGFCWVWCKWFCKGTELQLEWVGSGLDPLKSRFNNLQGFLLSHSLIYKVQNFNGCFCTAGHYWTLNLMGLMPIH